MINFSCMKLGKFYKKKFHLQWTTKNEEGLSRKREFQKNENWWNQKYEQWGEEKAKKEELWRALSR